MKLMIAFCVMVAALSIQTEAEYAELAINKLKDSVNFVSDQLKNLNDGLETDLSNQLNELYTKQMNQLEAVVVDTTTDAKKKIETATFEGKSVDHCLPPLESLIENQKKDIEKSLQMCVDNRLSGLTVLQEKISVHLEKKTAVLTELDQIVTDCKNDEDSNAADICIIKKLPHAGILVGKYHANGFILMGKAKSYPTISYVVTFNCFLEPSTAFRTSLQTGKVAVEQCIDSA